MKPVKPCCQGKPKNLDLFDPDELFDPEQAAPTEASCCSTEPAPEKPSCCGPTPTKEKQDDAPSDDCCGSKGKFDWLLWFSLTLVALCYPAHLFFSDAIQSIPKLPTFVHGVYEMMNKMWIGLFAGVLAVGFLSNVSRTFIHRVLGKGGTMKGILRATAAGLLLDMCNHGILLVAMQLHKRGASLGQTFAFLIASPWNSLSMTLILWGLIGWLWTLTFILASAVIAIIAGYIADKIYPVEEDLTASNKPAPPILKQIKQGWSNTTFNKAYFKNVASSGWRDSRSIMKWIFFGAILAASVRTFISPENFQAWFGPTLAGIGLTLLAATVIEVCSEGSSPVAADMVTAAKAPGNGFTFLMAGAATDYTEIMALKETTGKWKRALLLPMLTLPQVIAIAIVMNEMM